MWHEARRSERKVHDLMDAARRRAQRRAVFLAKRRGDPQQSLQIVGSRCRMYRDDGLYQATQDQQGLIPWNGKQNILIDRFDGRALLDFIRDCDSRMFRAQEKTEEEEELEEFVNFERYRDLIKHRRRGCRLISVCSTVTDEEGLQHANQELEEKAAGSFASERSYASQPSASKASYSQVGFSYEGDGKEESQLLECDDDDDDEDDDVDDDEEDSDDEGMEAIAKEFGVKRFNWLVYMDRKAKEEERRQKEVVKGDPAMKKLSRKERRKASQIERERERETACITGTRMHHYDPYREPRRSPTYEAYSRHRISRSKSRSCSPSHVRRYDRGSHADNGHRNKLKAPKIEYITEFGSSDNLGGQKIEAFSPPPSPSQANLLNRPSTGRILEALHVDPASAVSLDQEKNMKLSKPSLSTASALAKLSNPTATVGPLKPQQSEKKETPQERLKRIMSKQLNKQIKKDTVAEMARKRELERQRQEKLAETHRLSQYRRRSQSRSYSPSPRYRRSRSRSRSRSPRRYYSRSRSPRVRSHSRHH